jgi:hypothetical protein
MSPEAQRIAIAEACGFGGEFSKRWILEVGMEGEDKFAFAATRNNLDEEVPDYLNDLNAMHEAEELMIRSFGADEQYADELTRIASRANTIYMPRRAAISAKARHRAEAFLRALGKWEDGK